MFISDIKVTETEAKSVIHGLFYRGAKYHHQPPGRSRQFHALHFDSLILKETLDDSPSRQKIKKEHPPKLEKYTVCRAFTFSKPETSEVDSLTMATRMHPKVL